MGGAGTKRNLFENPAVAERLLAALPRLNSVSLALYVAGATLSCGQLAGNDGGQTDATDAAWACGDIDAAPAMTLPCTDDQSKQCQIWAQTLVHNDKAYGICEPRNGFAVCVFADHCLKDSQGHYQCLCGDPNQLCSTQFACVTSPSDSNPHCIDLCSE